jgi:hypothetical protein
MGWTNQDRLICPSIVPDAQFSAARKTQRHNAGLIKFANFQIAIFRRELDGQPLHSPTRHCLELEGAFNKYRNPPLEVADLSERVLPF